MARCKMCGKSSVFLSVNNQGYCKSCSESEQAKKEREEREIQTIMNGPYEGFLDRKNATAVYMIILACKQTGNSKPAETLLPIIRESLLQQYGVVDAVARFGYVLGSLQPYGILSEKEVKQYNQQMLDYVRAEISKI